MPAPSPSTNPPRCASNGRLAHGGFSLSGREGGQAVEAGHAERVDHRVRAAADHDVGVAAAEDLGRLADRLRAGGARGEAVHRRPAGAGEQRQVRQRHVRLLLQLAHDVHPLQRDLGPLHRVDLRSRPASTPSGRRWCTRRNRASLRRSRGRCRRDRGRASPRSSPAIFHACAHAASANCVLRPAVACCVASATCSARSKSFTSARDASWETCAASKIVVLRDAGLAVEQALPDRLDGMAHRGDPTHSGDDDSVHDIRAVIGQKL